MRLVRNGRVIHGHLTILATENYRKKKLFAYFVPNMCIM